MKKLFILSSLSLLFITSCKKEQLADKLNNPATVQQSTNVTQAREQLVSFVKSHSMAPRIDLGSKSQQLRKYEQPSPYLQDNKLSKNADYNFYYDLIRNAINPDDYQCGPTSITSYVVNSVQNWTDDDFLLFSYFGGISFDYAYVYANTNGGQYYGANSQFTCAINRTFKDLKCFWDIPNDILLRDAHGNIYSDTTKVKSVLLLYGYSDIEAGEVAGLLKTVFGSSQFMQYNHPLLTFNAFAAPADPYFGTPKKIVMGDGVQQAYQDLGLGDVAPQAILAHEYGHHIQFAKNVDFGSSPEETRRTELMADAFSAYFLTHKRGAGMKWKRVQQFLQVFYNIGDCRFESLGHHGTPNQRMKAADFGYETAINAKKKGKILTAEEFISLFDAALPEIVAPDAH